MPKYWRQIEKNVKSNLGFEKTTIQNDQGHKVQDPNAVQRNIYKAVGFFVGAPNDNTAGNGGNVYNSQKQHKYSGGHNVGDRAKQHHHTSYTGSDNHQSHYKKQDQHGGHHSNNPHHKSHTGNAHHVKHGNHGGHHHKHHHHNQGTGAEHSYNSPHHSDSHNKFQPDANHYTATPSAPLAPDTSVHCTGEEVQGLTCEYVGMYDHHNT